jgi:hypothetical protein
MLLALAQWVQSTALSAWLAGSTWAYPVIGGLHVLGIAGFGGAVLLSALHPRDREAQPRPAILWIGAAVMLLTGASLFVIEPLRCAASQSFRLKMLLLVILAVTSRVPSKTSILLNLTLWAGVLLVARGIAFF